MNIPNNKRFVRTVTVEEHEVYKKTENGMTLVATVVTDRMGKRERERYFSENFPGCVALTTEKEVQMYIPVSLFLKYAVPVESEWPDDVE